MIYKLPELPYTLDALEPYIDAQTMDLHYHKHHQTYIDNLNNALVDYPQLREKKLEDLLSDIDALPGDVRTAIKNNGGGTLNHTLFWNYMSPRGGGEPKGKLKKEIEALFGSYGAFMQEFSAAAKTRFGSGWAWLSLEPSGRLIVTSTGNQDTPLSQGLHPILGLDVWEHAYYLKYQNRRVDYIAAWWNLVNWAEVENHFEKIT